RQGVEVPLAPGLIRLDRTAPRDLSGHGRGPASDDEVEGSSRVDVLEERIPRDLSETETRHAEQHGPRGGEPDVREGHVDHDRSRGLVEGPALNVLLRIQDDLAVLRGRRDASVPGNRPLRGGPRPGEERGWPTRHGLRARIEDPEARLAVVPEGGGLPPREPDDRARSCRGREARRVRDRHRDLQAVRVGLTQGDASEVHSWVVRARTRYREEVWVLRVPGPVRHRIRGCRPSDLLPEGPRSRDLLRR